VANNRAETLERKYHRAKKLIKEFQAREEEFLRRETSFQHHINKLEDDLQTKVEFLQAQIQIQVDKDQQAKEKTTKKSTAATENENNNNRRSPAVQNAVKAKAPEVPPPRRPRRGPSDDNNTDSSSGPSLPVGVYDNLAKDMVGELDRALQDNRPYKITQFNSAPASSHQQQQQPNIVQQHQQQEDDEQFETQQQQPLRGGGSNDETDFERSEYVNISSRQHQQQQQPDEIERLMSQALNMDKTYQPTTTAVATSSSSLQQDHLDRSDYDEVSLHNNTFPHDHNGDDMLLNNKIPTTVAAASSAVLRRPLSATSTVSSLSETGATASSLKDGSNFGGENELQNLPNWSCTDVVNWLRVNDLQQHILTFQQYNVDGAKIANMDINFKDFGITNKTAKSNLKRRCKELKMLYEKRRKQAEKIERKKRKMAKNQNHRRSNPF